MEAYLRHLVTVTPKLTTGEKDPANKGFGQPPVLERMTAGGLSLGCLGGSTEMVEEVVSPSQSGER